MASRLLAQKLFHPPDVRIAPLLTKAHDLSRLATALSGSRVPVELRSMNSY